MPAKIVSYPDFNASASDMLQDGAVHRCLNKINKISEINQFLKLDLNFSSSAESA